EAPRVGGLVAGGERVPGHPRRLRLRGGVRRRAEGLRDAALQGRTRLEQRRARGHRPARARDAALVLVEAATDVDFWLGSWVVIWDDGASRGHKVERHPLVGRDCYPCRFHTPVNHAARRPVISLSLILVTVSWRPETCQR